MPFDLEDYWLEAIRQMALAFKTKKISYRISNAPHIPSGTNIHRISIALHTMRVDSLINGIVHNGSRDKGREFFYLEPLKSAPSFSKNSKSYGITFRISDYVDYKIFDCAYKNYKL